MNRITVNSELANKKNFFLLGDTHGEMSYFMSVCKRTNLSDMVIFHVGDFGAGFERRGKKWLDLINNFLEDINSVMYVIRGNHDDPSYFIKNHENNYFNPNGLMLVEDYTIVMANDRHFLLVGGAISVDRIARIETHYIHPEYPPTWWEGEEFNLDEDELNSDECVNITDVITHSAPDIVAPFGKIPAFIIANARKDSKLLQNVEDERKSLTEMFRIVTNKNIVNNWYYGHFHNSLSTKLDHTNFRLVDVCEILPI